MLTIAAALRNNSTQKSQLPYGISDAAIWIKDPVASTSFFLFDRFSLKPEECYFIDDLALNIEGARACGMDGYCFADGDAGKLKKVLEGFPAPVGE